MRRTISSLREQAEVVQSNWQLADTLDDLAQFLEERCDSAVSEGVAANEALKRVVDKLIQRGYPVEEVTDDIRIAGRFIEKQIIDCS
jgi:hypothetical protein